MKIAHVANFFMPERGYTEYYLAKKQHEMGHDVCVITSDRYPSSGKRYRKSGSMAQFEDELEVFRLPSAIELSGDVFVSINEFKRCLIDFSPDIVHIHSALSPLGFTSALYKHAIGYKTVANVISGIVIAEGLTLAIKKALLKIYTKTAWPYVSDRIDCFVAYAEAAVNWMQKEVNIDRSRIRFIPLGADSDLFCFNSQKRVTVREKLGVTDNDVIAIYTGKLLPYKKLDTLFSASAPLVRMHDDFRILIVGEGADQYVNHLRLITNNLNMNRNVIFHHAVHRTELPSFYSAADFAVWPGHHSISVIEAMSTGLPIIIPESRWMNHLLKFENGFSYTEGDVAGLRKRIHILLNNVELRREMGKRSRELVEKELNWNSIAEEYLRVYNSVLEKRNQL